MCSIITEATLEANNMDKSVIDAIQVCDNLYPCATGGCGAFDGEGCSNKGGRETVSLGEAAVFLTIQDTLSTIQTRKEHVPNYARG